MKVPFRSWLWLVVLACACLTGCSRADPRSTDRDSAPTAGDTTRLREPLPTGRAEAFFALNTGGDQMTTRTKEPSLVVVLRFADREIRRTVATCPDPALGSALGAGTDRELEVAMCNGEYRLIADTGQVKVLRTDKHPKGDVVAYFTLPSAAMRAVKPMTR